MSSISPPQIIVTGGAGFIGGALVRFLMEHTSVAVMNVDSLTYAGNLESLTQITWNSRYRFEKTDITNAGEMARLFSDFQPDAIIHLAAESHVDRSIDSPGDFIHTNITGTATLLNVARDYWQGLDKARQSAFRFHHVSTDEVFGDLADSDGLFHEDTAYAPSSPYAASKAGSDHLVRAWHRTYGLPVVISNCSNNFGPYQFPEKLIPLMILNACEGKTLPIYGDGLQVRDWLYVEDHVRAIWAVLQHGECGQTYLIGGNNQLTNLEVIHSLCQLLDEKIAVKPPGIKQHKELIQFIKDRPGHDRRYAVDASKIQRELGWAPQETFESGLEKTVDWYLANPQWIENVRTGAYRNWIKHHYE